MFIYDDFIDYYNFVHGSKYSTNTERIRGLLAKVEGFAELEEMKAYADYTNSIGEHDIYKNLAGNKVADFIREYHDKKKREEEEAKASNVDEVNSAIGLVERALADVMVEKYSDVLASDVFQKVDNYIEENYGKITKKIEYQIPQRHSVLKEITHEKFEEVLSFVLADEPVMLVGEAGTGKNIICKQVADAMNLDFYSSNAVTQEHKLTGFIDANGRYHETEFYKAFTKGGLFFLDEIDGSIPEVLIILNSAIANRYFEFPTGRVQAHEDFRVISAGNTYGTGASYQYTGRQQLDSASLDRFAIVNIDYSPTIENSLTEDDSLLQFIREYREACHNNGINQVVSYRAIIRLDKLKTFMGKAEILKTCLCKGLEVDDLNMIKNTDFTDNEWSTAFINEICR